MQRRHQISLKSYDRLFPNQDTMPTGGFGNLIALPLQKIPRRSDNSVFVDDHLAPFPDQWRYLAGIPRMEPFAVERLVRSLERNGNVVGVRMSLADNDSGEIPGCFRRRDGCRKNQLPDRFPNPFALYGRTFSSSRKRVCRKPCWIG